MKRVASVVLLALFAGCADGLTAPRDPQADVRVKSGALASDVYCFIEFDGCIPYVPPPPPPTPLVPYPCHFELRVDEHGQLIEVLVCP